MNILFLNKSHPILYKLLKDQGCKVIENYTDPKEVVENNLKGIDGIVFRSRISIDKQFLDATKDLKFIAREGVGVEHIDLEYAKVKGVEVITSPEGSRDTVGEHALGLLLGLMNNLMRADKEIRLGQWNRESNRGVEVKGKTVGVLGYGNMGSAFAKKISGFDAKVIAYDKYKTGYADAYAEEVDLDTFFEKVDILSIHIPYFPENLHFINKAFLNSFHKDIYLVNTARGLVLNTQDLVDCLESGKVLGAALDVLEYEEQSFDDWNFEDLPAPFHYLINADKVVLSPHIAGWSFESKEGHARVLASKIKDFINQKCTPVPTDQLGS